jgi:hypothetical protein
MIVRSCRVLFIMAKLPRLLLWPLYIGIGLYIIELLISLKAIYLR